MVFWLGVATSSAAVSSGSRIFSVFVMGANIRAFSFGRLWGVLFCVGKRSVIGDVEQLTFMVLVCCCDARKRSGLGCGVAGGFRVILAHEKPGWCDASRVCGW